MAKSVSSADRDATGSSILSTQSRKSDAQPSPKKVLARQPHTVERKSSVADLLSRLTASTAASRSKKRDKGETPSPGPQSGEFSAFGGSRSVSLPTPNSTGSSPSLFHRLTFGSSVESSPKRPVISRPMPAPSPTSDGLIVGRVRNSSRSPSKGTHKPPPIRTGSPAPSIKSSRSQVTPGTPILPPHLIESSSMNSSRSSSFDRPRPAPQRPRNVSGRSSALGRPNNLARSSSRQRKGSAGKSGLKPSDSKAKSGGLENSTELHIECNERIKALEAELGRERAMRLELEAQQRPTSEISPRTSVVDLASLKDELEILKNELAASKLDKQQAVERLKQSQTELSGAFEAADVLKVARNNLEWQVKGLQVNHRTLEQQLTISQRTTRRCRRTITSLETKVKELQVQLEEKNLENEELNQTIERIMKAAQHYWRNVQETANHPSPALTDSQPGSPPGNSLQLSPAPSAKLLKHDEPAGSKQLET